MTFNDIEESQNGKYGKKKSDIAILGVPFDLGSTNHTGQRNAPFEIRNAGFWQEGMLHVKEGVDPMELMVVDVGDVEFSPGDTNGGWQAIRDTAKQVYTNTRHLISIGGDHSCTAKLVQGVSQKDGHPLTVFHFDAHTDYSKHDPDIEMNHGSWVRRVLEENVASRVVQFGIRGWGVPAADKKWATKNDVVTYYAQDMQWMKHLGEEVDDTPDDIYLSIDLDVLDPCFAPGVAYREPGGITTRELFRAISIIAGSGKLVAADVMECIPDRDPSGVTTKVANRCVAQLMTGIAQSIDGL